MSRNNTLRIRSWAWLLAMFSITMPVLPDCLPVVNTPIAVNGIVVRTAAIAAGTCKGDPGWDGAPAATFTVPGSGAMDSHVPKLFATSHASGANLDHLYIGVHVENAEQFTHGDMLNLWFDTDNNGAFDGKDFALHFEIGPQSPPIDEQCNKVPPLINLYNFSGGNWVQTGGSNPPGITAKTSYDYDNAPPDVEHQIWELEIDIDLTTVNGGVTIPASGKIGMGAKLTILTPVGVGGTSIVLDYPQNLLCDAMGSNCQTNPNDIDPNTGGVTPAKLAIFDIGTCGFDVVIDQITSTDTKSQTNYFTTFPTAIGGTLSGSQTNTFNATVRFYDPANPLATTLVGAPDAGGVRLFTMPYGSSGFVGSPIQLSTSDLPASFTQLGQTQVVTVQWPTKEAQYAPHRADFATAASSIGGHTCFKAELHGFPVNINEAADVVQINLTFTAMSTVKDSFHIKTAKEERYATGGYVEYLLRPRWQNVPKGSLSPDPRKHPKGKFGFEFENAKALKLKYLGKGYWLLRMKQGEDKLVKMELTGGPMPFKTTKIHVSPKAGGKLFNPSSGEDAMMVPVQEGATMSIVANGRVSVDRGGEGRGENGPEGFANRAKYQSRFLVNEGSSCVPWQNAGTLVGSFDNFQTSFRIGGTTTLVVPPGAKQLAMAVNDVIGEYDDNGGPGYDVNIVFGTVPTLPTRLAGVIANPANGQPAELQMGAAMPRLNIDVDVLNRKLRAAIPQGYVSWAVYESHPEK